MFLLGLFVLLNNVGVGDADAEIYGVGDRIVRLTVFVGWIGVGVEAVVAIVRGSHSNQEIACS